MQYTRLLESYVVVFIFNETIKSSYKITKKKNAMFVEGCQKNSMSSSWLPVHYTSDFTRSDQLNYNFDYTKHKSAQYNL